MIKYNFDEVIDRSGTNCYKWDKKPMGDESVIAMWVADMDFAVPPEVSKAIVNRAKHPLYGYTIEGDDYWDGLISWYKHRHNITLDKKWLLYSPGVVVTVNSAINEFTSIHDGIVTQTPTYPPLQKGPLSHKRKLIKNPLTKTESSYVIDFDNLESAFKNGVKFLLFSSPHNPTGRVWTSDELSKVSKLCVKYDIIVVSDDIH